MSGQKSNKFEIQMKEVKYIPGEEVKINIREDNIRANINNNIEEHLYVNVLPNVNTNNRLLHLQLKDPFCDFNRVLCKNLFPSIS
uniref:Uncharacterized protein n=1 Tax=Strigamia maritima TaxID=126957 RepID=T1J3A1_STRMM